MHTIGRKTQQIRELRGYSQDYMAQQLHLSTNAYSNIETGKSDPSYSRLEQIAQALETDVLQMLSFDPQIVLNNQYNRIRNDQHIQIGGNGEALKTLEVELTHLKTELQMKDEIMQLLREKLSVGVMA